MAAIFMKDKRNVFSSETPSKSFYCPSLPRQLATEFSMSYKSEHPPNGIQRKSRSSPAETKYLGANSEASTADRATKSISESRVDGTDQDSILAKYIERFRRAKPSSRESRPMKDELAFWWKDTEPETPPQPSCLRSPDLQPPQSYPFETPSTLSTSNHTDRGLEEPIDKSEVIVKSNGCHGSSLPVQEGYRGTHHHSPLPAHHHSPFPAHHQPLLPAHHQPPLLTRHHSPLPAHHQPPLPTHHEDILYQWRLRRRLEQAQDIVGNCYIDPGDHKPTYTVPQSRYCGNDDLASVHSSVCLTPPTSCCNGMHSTGVIPKTFDSAVNDIKPQDVAYTEAAVSENEKQTPMILHKLQSTGTQTIPDCSQEGSFTRVPLSDPNPVPIPPKPSVLYPDTSLLTTTADSSFNNSNTSDFEQSFSTTTCGTAEIHPLVSECVEQRLLHTTPHPVARPAGATHISSSSSDTGVSSMEDELLHLLIVRARLLETQLRQIDSCLTAVEECPM